MKLDNRFCEDCLQPVPMPKQKKGEPTPKDVTQCPSPWCGCPLLSNEEPPSEQLLAEAG